MIKLCFRSCDGARQIKKYNSLKGAQKAVAERLGPCEISSGGYAISSDGICALTVEGASLQDVCNGPAMEKAKAAARAAYEARYES